MLLGAIVLLVATACGSAATHTTPTGARTAAQKKLLGTKYCAANWNVSGAAAEYGPPEHFLPKIRVYRIAGAGLRGHGRPVCSLITATQLDQIDAVFVNTFDGAGWQLDQTDAHAMQVNGVAAAYPPNAYITAAGTVHLGREQKAAGPPAASPPPTNPASLSQFTGQWGGHGRGMSINASGIGTEFQDAGCCTLGLKLGFRLTRATGTTVDAKASGVVTSVTIGRGWPPHATRPRVGDQFSLELRNGLITDQFGAPYCGPHTQVPGNPMPCGA